MDLRPYQVEFVDACLHSWEEHKNILGVAATGAGKTILASEIMRRTEGRSLFIADAVELINQNADKYRKHTGDFPSIEMGPHRASLNSKVVISSAQSLWRRLDRFPRNHFERVIIDEAHRCTLGAMSQTILQHFESAEFLGMTATPFRSDRKSLGEVYSHIAIEVGLERLIREGYLTRIHIKSVPLTLDLRDVRTTAGDYNAADLGTALEPHLLAAAEMIADHAVGAGRKKTVVFLPLVATANAFASELRRLGVRAVAASGNDKSELAEFTDGDAKVICNAALLTTGWDCPPVDCICILRPTKSLALYQQMIGRGTRLFPGKDNLLVLDPLYLADDHNLITPARLLARTQEQADAIDKELSTGRAPSGSGGGNKEMDLLDVDSGVQAQREEALAKKLADKQTRDPRLVDAVEFSLSLHQAEGAEYTPEFAWEGRPVSPNQKAMLENAGFDMSGISCMGHAAKIIDVLISRRNAGLATPKQMKFLKKFRHPSPDTCSFTDAKSYLDAAFAGNLPHQRRGAPVAPRVAAIPVQGSLF